MELVVLRESAIWLTYVTVRMVSLVLTANDLKVHVKITVKHGYKHAYNELTRGDFHSP